MLAIKTNYMCKPDQYYSIFQLFSLFTAFTTHVEVFILQCETVDFPDLTCYIQLHNLINITTALW